MILVWWRWKWISVVTNTCLVNAIIAYKKIGFFFCMFGLRFVLLLSNVSKCGRLHMQASGLSVVANEDFDYLLIFQAICRCIVSILRQIFCTISIWHFLLCILFHKQQIKSHSRTKNYLWLVYVLQKIVRIT